MRRGLPPVTPVRMPVLPAAAIVLACGLFFASAARAADSVTVTVELPIPQKVNTRGVRKILVARFVADDENSIDTGRETVSVIRRILARGTPFQILDVDPPNLPEQPVDVLLRNYTFWKHIAEEYGADLVVSGKADYTTQDRSGFVQEDIVSPLTGQKVRRTRFAEREDYQLELNLWFFKGANGALLYEDSFRGSQLYEGKNTDALQAFFNLFDGLEEDILGVLVPRKRRDPRKIFTD